MAAALPAYQGAFRDDVLHGASQTAAALAFLKLLEGTLQTGCLLVVHLHCIPETEVLGEELLCLVPGEGVAQLLLLGVQLALQLHGTHALRSNSLEIQLIGTFAEGKATRLVVGTDDDERLVGMLLVELVGDADGVVHVDELGDEDRVVCMAAPVNLAAFDHQEEAVLLVLLLHEEVDGSACDVLQREVVLCAVDGIGDRAALYLAGFFGLEENHLLSFLGLLLILLVAAHDGEATLLCLLIEVGTAIGVLGLVEVRSAEEVDIRLGELFAYLVVFASLSDVSIEGSGCGVVDADACRDADGGACFACPVSNAGDRGRQVLQYAQGAVLCLVAAGKGCAACCRVGHAVRGTLCVDEADVGEAGEAEFLDADAAFQGAEVGLGGIDLVDAHAVADEVEHVLGLALGKGSQSNHQNAQE